MSAEDTRQPAPADISLRPGAQVFVVLHKDPLRERIDVRESRVLDLEPDVLFLAQTDPPVPRGLGGEEVEVAVIAETGGGAAKRPMGYVARLLDVMDGFPVGRSNAVDAAEPAGAEGGVPALAVSAPVPGDFFETSLRMHYRVPVEPEMRVVILLEDFESPELLDFSAGGARVRVRTSEPAAADLAVGRSVPFRLLFLGSGYAAGDGVVRSLQRSDDGASLSLGLFFTNMEIRDIRYLERMVARTVSACRQRERDADYV